MFEGLVHVQPLKLRLLTAGDDIDVVAAAQTMVEDAQEAVPVGRVVHANRRASARQRIVDEARRLMAKAIVILSPHVARQEDV